MRAAFFIFCAKSRGAPRQIFRQNVRRNSDIHYRDSFNLPMQIPNQGSVSQNGERAMENLLIFWRKAPILKAWLHFCKNRQKGRGMWHSALRNTGNRNPIFRIRNRKESALGATYRKELCFRLEPDRKKTRHSPAKHKSPSAFAEGLQWENVSEKRLTF